MKIIAFVGMPASGKSEASAIAKKIGIPVVNMGDAVREEASRRGLKLTDENIGGTGTSLRKEEGMDAIAKRCVPGIHKIDASIVVVDGIRNIDEINYFKKEFGNDFRLIAINTPFDIRFDRVKKRARSDDMNSIDELKRRDDREKGWGLDRAILKADINIDNTGSIDNFRKQIEQLLENI